MTLTVVAVACLALLGAHSASAQATTSISGTVVARGDGQAVDQATVSVDGTSLRTQTNGIGRFRLDNVPVGPVVLVVSKRGFLDARVSGVRTTANGLTAVSIELDPTLNFLDRVQVTATIAPLSVGDVAAQADVVDRATIDGRGAQSLTEAVAHVPGAVVSTMIGQFESVLLRGLPRHPDFEFTTTLLMIDGVPQTNGNNAARVVALPIFDASRIEVVRGPNSALYGRTAVGGSINIQTADPTPAHEFGVDLAGGQFGTLKGVARASGPIAQWGGYYVSVGRDRNSGYFENKTLADFEMQDTELFAKLSFAPDRSSFGRVTFNRVVSTNNTPTNEPLFDDVLLHEINPRFDRFTNFNIPGGGYNQTENRFTVNYTREVSASARAVGVFAYRQQLYNFHEDGDFIEPLDLESNLVAMFPFTQMQNERIYYQEGRLELTPATARKQSLILGASYDRTSGTLDNDFIYTDEDLFGFPINYLNPVIPPRSEWQHDTESRTYHLSVAGLFGQYIVEPSPKWVLTLGGRYDHMATDHLRSGSLFEKTYNAFSPKLSVTYKALTATPSRPVTLNVYGAHGRAFIPKRPLLLRAADANIDLRPEQVDNFEAGIKGSALDERLSFEATSFFTMHDDVVLATREGPFFVDTNAGEQRYKGVELGARFGISPKAAIYANTAFYRHRFGTFIVEHSSNPGRDEVLTGNRLPISPRVVANVGLELRPASFLEANVDVKHVGEVAGNRSNSYTLDAYTLVDAALSWVRGPIRLTLAVTNLLNTEYYWNGNTVTADPGRPRRILVTSSFSFKRPSRSAP